MNRKLRREVRRRRMHSWDPAQHNRHVARNKAIRRFDTVTAPLTAVLRGLSVALDRQVAAMVTFGRTAVAAAADIEKNQAKLTAAFADYSLLPRSRSLGFDPTDHDDEDTE